MTDEPDALNAALQAEDAAVYAYGIVAAYSLAARQDSVTEFIAAHRAQRDSVAAAVKTAGASAQPAAPAYKIPTPVTDGTTAAKLAVTAEEGCAQAYRQLLSAAGSDGVRRIALGGLTGAATRAARWRIALNIAPATPSLPGGDA
ncbi:ferritin-like domain-containing protein [Tsukamurella sp. 8F]|uniref:ferritin-like domain-containing protein n=1 Tax=unclassified Tsukamurella TaxID=2633480 RepID=UPI0023B9A98F|nr:MULTISPECIES: ferritin-like domain-containing protein [unclassified Tsukamurella]MDF0531611.1 ferritin-like domain-containing protein [Tsukamurella sp. 8J]MDF0587542.1 ferritin-like domain-containing protein [Tsukamurella sp. 8F]